ncbi:MAG: hypothetical protein IGS38_16190 [Synechococcales cyanobacterium M58_A2018_015]|nr:hypothetical protein [Synechococcales cyanobacterium M58_A2018_015]
MKTMGQYCKAYLVKQLRQYPHWGETTETPLSEDDVLYLQENYVVTANIFKDEQIVFDQVTPEWTEFCHTVLQFEIPQFTA